MWVRSSTSSYGSFNLDMDRSPGFGSTLTDLFALLTLAFTSAPDLKSLTLPVRVTRRTVLQKVRSSSQKEVPQLVNIGFQVLFHSPPGVLFTFPSQYYALSVTKEYLALRGGPRSFPQGFSCLVVLWILLGYFRLRIRGFHPLWPAFPGRSPVLHNPTLQSEPQDARILVWALSISLAATLEIEVSFFSSGYLDVSVPPVPFHTLWIGVWIHEVCSCGFPHSDISGSRDICSSPKLIAAYHVFHRLLVPRHPPYALSTLTIERTIVVLSSSLSSSVMTTGNSFCLMSCHFL